MLGKRIFVRIGLQVFAGILCSLLISCGSAETTPQPNLYTLEEALTLAAQTLQAESRVTTPSKTPTPVDNSNISNEQADSEKNPEEPVVPVTGDTDEEPSLSVSGDNSEETDSTNSGGNSGGTGSSPKDRPEPDPHPKLPEKKIGTSVSDTVDPNKIEKFFPNFSGVSCDEVMCVWEKKLELTLNNQNDVGPLPPPANIGRCGTSGDCEEKKEKGSDDTGEEPPPAPIEIPPLPPITLPGQPPLPPFPPPIFP